MIAGCRQFGFLCPGKNHAVHPRAGRLGESISFSDSMIIMVLFCRRRSAKYFLSTRRTQKAVFGAASSWSESPSPSSPSSWWRGAEQCSVHWRCFEGEDLLVPQRSCSRKWCIVLSTARISVDLSKRNPVPCAGMHLPCRHPLHLILRPCCGESLPEIIN